MNLRLVRTRWLWLFLALAVGGAGGRTVFRALLGSRRADIPALRRASDATSRDRAEKRPDSPSILIGTLRRDGVQVECRIAPISQNTEARVELREGQDVRFEFAVSEASGNAPLSKLYPAAWLVERAANSPPATPKEALKRAEALINGSLFAPASLDLNVYYVLTLNHNATVTVVDPLFGFGGTKLLALVPLAANGVDWALSLDGNTLFVAMPEVNQIARIDTQSWKVTANVPAGIRPRRVALQPDGKYLWVAGGAGDSGDSGVTVLRGSDAGLVARIRAGRGEHDLAFTDDSEFAFVTNSDEGTVSIIEIDALREVAPLPAGRRPLSVTYGSKAGLAYVSDPADGNVWSVDPRRRQVVNRIAIEPGLGRIGFSPDGYAAFVVNTERNKVYVIDPMTNRVVQETRVEEGPDRVSFSNDFAYIRHRGSIDVGMISLKSAGRAGAPLSYMKFPAGQSAPGAMSEPTPADSIVPAPGGTAVLVANPRDQAVYYYKEGLAAPMGTFSNYKREPRAVLVIDRSLRERARSGVYETVARLDRAGHFDLTFVLDQPRLVHAFNVEVVPDAERESERTRGRVDIEPLVTRFQIAAGKQFRPLFQLTERASGKPRAGLTDVYQVMYRVGGQWQKRAVAREVFSGVYAAEFLPTLPGTYHVFTGCDSARLSLNNPQRLTVVVTDLIENKTGESANAAITDSQDGDSQTADHSGNRSR